MTIGGKTGGGLGQTVRAGRSDKVKNALGSKRRIHVQNALFQLGNP